MINNNFQQVPVPISQRRTYPQEYVRQLFDSIAHRYDFINHMLSFGIDVLWRKRAIKLLSTLKPQSILDIATGTGDCALLAAVFTSASIVAIDISPTMLACAQEKVVKNSLSHRISFLLCSAEHLPFPNGSFNACTIAFGARNFENLKKAFSEIHRVLTQRGHLIILEFSQPTTPFIKQLYTLYSRWLIPAVGGYTSGNRDAYLYLPQTIAEFPSGEDFCTLLKESGFQNVVAYPQTFGITTIYVAQKL
ncbi:MAG: bifunctional demethylmenaquinone methyltransferase/2-methoxy-6-polyprenyl-1,4-benzoquinol methylase UbiE [Bacteroidetes bacterium]|nr:bifunctional demethylmenaquinone methyltransferase/2-methoxy-6-polyprenyl-1,4-benzoquinol methylase UbiE [Bacteroidota bacterium]